jgi:hypothetical protein
MAATNSQVRRAVSPTKRSKRCANPTLCPEGVVVQVEGAGRNDILSVSCAQGFGRLIRVIIVTQRM